MRKTWLDETALSLDDVAAELRALHLFSRHRRWRYFYPAQARAQQIVDAK